ncbi:non-canonical purine NTP pyrophosphatase, partial [Candidatus Falkowbacteria bacterium CG10_big_fil_rev_8_21_14_0_10_43_11]
FLFKGVGFEGIFKLLRGKDKKAYFKTVMAYCEPDEESVLFEAEMHGEIAAKVVLSKADAMPYDHIFIPDGHKKAIVQMSMEEKNSFSQRGQAARKLGEYLRNKK